jgi:hypothetical protein
MQSFARVLWSLLLLLSWTASTSSQTQNKQKPAEAAVDKVIRRFHETLDFADVYREFLDQQRQHSKNRIKDYND